MSIIVSKFGGTSVANFVAMKRSAEIAKMRGSKIVLVSATSGTTNQLVELANIGSSLDLTGKLKLIEEIRLKHLAIAKDIGAGESIVEKVLEFISSLETLVRGTHLLKDCSPKYYDRIVAIGELVSSTLFTEVLNSVWVDKNVKFFDIREVMKTTDSFMKAEPLLDLIERESKERFDLDNDKIVYVSQGFIGSTTDGMTTTFGRGGSDYSAALIAEAVGADVLEIWTDVDGVMTTDPRVCPKARPIRELTFKEASELANFGAKVLHPTTIWPSLRKGFPVFVGSTMTPEMPGTWIRKQIDENPLVRGISFKKNQVLLSISTPVMSRSYGFLARIFEIFNKFQISVDVVTTSEISVAVTVDQDIASMRAFLDELGDLGHIKIEKEMTLVSIIGNNINYTPGFLKDILNTIEGINVRAISGGASKHNVNFLVPNAHGEEVVKKIHARFLE
jgi:aspartate kinase